MTVSIGKQGNSAVVAVCTPKSSRIRNDTALLWLWESLLTSQLESRLRCLLSDNEHLTNCYDVTTAFLCCPKFVGALYICFDAFKLGQYENLLTIDTNLYAYREHVDQQPRDHDQMHDPLAPTKPEPHKKVKRKRSIRLRYKLKHLLKLSLRPWASLPEIHWIAGPSDGQRSWANSWDTQCQPRSQLTLENLAIRNRRDEPAATAAAAVASTSQPPTQATINQLQPISLVKCDNIKIHTDRRHAQSDRSLSALTFGPASTAESNLVPFMSTMKGLNMAGAAPPALDKPSMSSAPAEFSLLFATNGAKIDKSYLDDTFPHDATVSPDQTSPKYLNGGCTLVPTRGQTLAAYLQEAQQMRRHITDLERENAHFALSDVIISAIEEIKCNLNDKQKEAGSKPNKVRPIKSNKLRTWYRSNSLSIGDKATPTIGDELSLIQSRMNICSNSTSETDLSHISSDTDTSQANAGNLDRLKVIISPYSKLKLIRLVFGA